MTDFASGSRRYLALAFPLLPAERAMRAGAAPPDAPFVLVEKVRGAMRIAAADARALLLEITPGLALADARARAPDLIALDHDPGGDNVMLNWLADGCDRYTPMVAIDPPDGLILDITGCAHGFAQGEIGLAKDLAFRLDRLGLTVRHARAATPDAAVALARFGLTEKAIPRLPVSALRVPPDIHLALRRAGLKTIGDLAERHRAPLAARFGAETPTLLARLLGEEDIRITPRRTAPALVVEARFAEPMARTADVLATLNRLAGEAQAELAGRGGGGRRFAVALFRSDGHVARLEIETGAPTRDPAVLARLLGERIDSLSDPLDPGFGYDLIRLAVPVIEPLGPAQLRLEGGVVAEAEFAALIDRLSIRLGRDRVRRFIAQDSHLPEQASLELPATAARSLSPWPEPQAGEPPARPIHLFDPPQRIEVIAEAPDGPPRRFRWRRTLHEVTRYEGPERIAAEWWRRRDNGGLTRDYYRIEDARGRRFWLFRHGLYGTEKTNPTWYLHGLFA